MQNAAIHTAEDLSTPFKWPADGVARVPYRLFSDEEIYALEQQRIFKGPVWHYLCLEIEIPELGDYKTTHVGDTPVVVTRGEGGAVHAMVNRCAHKGALVCLKERGNAKTLSCVYHAWTYDLEGQLKGVAFRNGIKGNGGMPDDFDVKKHRLQPLRVQTLHGLVFGTFSDEVPPVDEWLGETMMHYVRRNFGRRLKLLGTHSQLSHNNWKLYAENVRDSYHATLLHTFYTTFKVNRLDMDGGIVIADGTPWHHVSYAKRSTLDESSEYVDSKVHSAQYESKLEAPNLLNSWNEFEDGITHIIHAVFPTLTFHFTLNSLAVRFFTPRGHDKTELFWIYLGYEDDTEEQERMRIMQGNLTGAAGLVSLEDGCINEFVQRGTRGSSEHNAFMEMGGRTVESSKASRATEVAIRGFWTGYKELMGLD